jgi:branched-chain amino acid transport system permease protein
MPAFLRGPGAARRRDFGVLRLFLVGDRGGALTGALGFLVARTRFGAQVRAAVDDAVAPRAGSGSMSIASSA